MVVICVSTSIAFLCDIVAVNTCVIGFVFINDGRNMSNFDSYAMSVDEVEKITGFNFFASLPKKVETKVEAMTYSQWKNIIK